MESGTPKITTWFSATLLLVLCLSIIIATLWLNILLGTKWVLFFFFIIFLILNLMLKRPYLDGYSIDKGEPTGTLSFQDFYNVFISKREENINIFSYVLFASYILIVFNIMTSQLPDVSTNHYFRRGLLGLIVGDDVVGFFAALSFIAAILWFCRKIYYKGIFIGFFEGYINIRGELINHQVNYSEAIETNRKLNKSVRRLKKEQEMREDTH